MYACVSGLRPQNPLYNSTGITELTKRDFKKRAVSRVISNLSTHFVDTDDKLADILTKALGNWQCCVRRHQINKCIVSVNQLMMGPQYDDER